jgi:hypothetical protein
LSAPIIVIISAILSIIIVRSSFNGLTVNNSVQRNLTVMRGIFFKRCQEFFERISNIKELYRLDSRSALIFPDLTKREKSTLA